MENLLSIQHLSNEQIESFLEQANELKKEDKDFSDYTVALLFFEPSTRTKMSFEKACYELGINVLSFTPEFSSVVKGESLYDTVKTLEAIGVDLIVIRDSKEKYYEDLEGINIPIINAGDGTGEHPTQTLLDLLTIKQEFKRFEDLNVVICGDIKHSRVARSNAYALSQLGANVSFVAQDEFKDNKLSIPYIEMDEAVQIADVLMLLRVQKERHEIVFSDNLYLEKYGLTRTREQMMKPHSIIMHPAPINRGVEIDHDLVECSRSRIFKQMRNGVIMRKVILKHFIQLGGDN
ncbi:aspartate carbamoyltransferase catalytic subunit [Bacillaceae bacterium W0354]